MQYLISTIICLMYSACSQVTCLDLHDGGGKPNLFFCTLLISSFQSVVLTLGTGSTPSPTTPRVVLTKVPDALTKVLSPSTKQTATSQSMFNKRVLECLYEH